MEQTITTREAAAQCIVWLYWISAIAVIITVKPANKIATITQGGVFFFTTQCRAKFRTSRNGISNMKPQNTTRLLHAPYGFASNSKQKPL
jgi:hypothetical protein